MILQDAEKQGLLYPPDPGEKFATVGGNVATNAGMRAVIRMYKIMYVP